MFVVLMNQVGPLNLIINRTKVISKDASIITKTKFTSSSSSATSNRWDAMFLILER